ncbi:MAG: LysR family transcriptional regulator [Lachnospiraceae bacterium]|nr:LysR family transcriptional regulator [Lachnospiraceae bacterium]
MNLKQIEAFIKIANNQSFSKTAREMYLTQPTVSAAIKNLEDELGITLFVRNTRGVELTEGGKQIYLYAKQMCEAASAIQMISKDRSQKEQISHELVISASTIPAQYLLPELMARFSSRYPETQFRVSVSDSANVARDIETHKAVIGMCGTVPEGRNYTCIPFYQDELVVITPNTEAFRNRVGQPVASWIREESLILREEGSGTRTEAIRFLRDAGIPEEELNVTARIGNTGAILHAVKKGLGVTILSRLAAEEEEAAGRVLLFPISKEGSMRSIYIIYNAMFPQTESVKRFVLFAKKYYKQA